MQIREMTWTNLDSHYSLEEKSDGSIELSVDGRAVVFQDRQAVRGLIEGWNQFDQQNKHQNDEPPKMIASDQLSMPVGTDFPKKIRNAIFIMVAVGATILVIDSLQHMM
jgi:hypothetical protein